MKMIDGRFIGYPALIKRIEDGKYFVKFPDLSGCISQGGTLEQALCMAQESLAIYYNENNGDLPLPSDLFSIKNLYQDCIVQMVAIDKNNYFVKPMNVVKKTLTIPEWLNELGVKYNVNFSKILKNALINHLKELDSISEYDLRKLN